MDSKMPPQQIIKENPIGMLRKGGHSFIETNYDETNRFYIEDSPCNFSVASGLSDLTVESHSAGLLKTTRLESLHQRIFFLSMYFLLKYFLLNFGHIQITEHSIE